MEEVLIVTSSSTTSMSFSSSTSSSSSSSGATTGLAAFDMRGGGGVVASFKNCTAQPGAMCTIKGSSAFSGLGSYTAEYIAVSDTKKATINIYTWGKPQPLMQCHIHEVATAIVTDVRGAYLFAGCKTGKMTCWDLSNGDILKSWQAHYKTISRVQVTNCSSFVISSSDDGSVKVWDFPSIVDVLFKDTGTSRGDTVKPFRSYSPHVMPIKDTAIMGSCTAIKVITCSLDKTVVMYDVCADTTCLKIGFPSSLESILCNCSEDMMFAGASNGKIFIVDLAERAVALSAAHSQIASVGTDGVGVLSAINSRENTKGHMCLEGHTSSVTSLAISIDNTTLVSASSDCSIRIWDTITRQCLRESKPFHKSPLSNVS